MFYQFQILNLEDTVMERRIKENEMLQEPVQSIKNRTITLLELKIHLESLISQIQLIAFIVIKPYKEIMEYDRKALREQDMEINGDIDGM